MDERDLLRSVFSTPQGQRALALLLTDAGYFDVDVKEPDEIAVQNYFKRLLHRMGVYGVDNIEGYVGKLFELPISGESNGHDKVRKR